MVLAVHVLDVVDHLFAATLLEVDVDIGHLHALGVQEPLEQQAVFQRVEVGDAHGVRHDGASRRPAARTHADALAARPFNVFLHDEEVRGEAGVQDDLGFGVVALHDVGAQFLQALEARQHGLAVVRVEADGLLVLGGKVAPDQAHLAFLAEPRFLGFAFGQGEARQNGVALELDVALLGHFDRRVARLGEFAERRAHLLFGLHVELVVGKAHALGVVDLAARADAQQNVVCARVVLHQVMEIVRGDGLETARLRHAGELLVQLQLRQAAIGRQALVLQFDVEIARVEAGRQLARPFAGVFELAVVKQLRHAGKTRRAADDAMAVFLQLRIGGARLVIVIVDVRLADQLQQVVVTLVRLGQQQQVVQPRLAIARQGVVGREVHLAPVDGLHLLARFLFHGGAGVAELGHAAHDAVVGNGDSGHVEFGGAAHHVFHMGHAVENRVFGMVVQMDECHG